MINGLNSAAGIRLPFGELDKNVSITARNGENR